MPEEQHVRFSSITHMYVCMYTCTHKRFRRVGFFMLSAVSSYMEKLYNILLNMTLHLTYGLKVKLERCWQEIIVYQMWSPGDSHERKCQDTLDL